MGTRINIQVATHFIIMKELADGIFDLQFKCIADFIDAVKVLKEFKCRFTRFQANEGEYYHIFTNRAGISTLTIYYE